MNLMDYIHYTLTDPELNNYKQCSVQIQVGLVVNAIQTVVSLLFVKVEDSDYYTQNFYYACSGLHFLGL